MERTKKTTLPKTEKAESGASKKVTFITAVGRRKTAIARVRLIEQGSGEITINGQPMSAYFPNDLHKIVTSALEVVGQTTAFDVTVKVQGGGSNGQAAAIRHGIARALIKYNPELRASLKPLDLLKRDPRQKERKKPGLRRARRAPQFSKR